jgi:hypothetical protein
LKEPKPIIVLPPDTSEKSLREVRKAGYVAILSSPEKVKIVLPSFELSGSDLLMSAMKGLAGSYDSNKAAFFAELFKRMQKREVETICHNA